MGGDEEEGGGFEPPYMPDNAGTVLQSFDYTDIIEEIEKRLKRMKIGVDENDNKVWKTPEKITPLMNDNGVDDCIVLITSICQRITGLSNIDEKERNRIFILLRQIGSRLIEILAKNYTKYEMKDPCHIALVYEMVMNPLEFALRQPIGEGGRLFVSETTKQTSEQIIKELPEG